MNKSLPERQQDILSELSAQAKTTYQSFQLRAQAILAPGKKVAWMRCGHRQIGTVSFFVKGLFETVLCVRNQITGKQYRIDIFDYFQADQSGLDDGALDGDCDGNDDVA